MPLPIDEILRLHEISEAGHRILDPFTDAQVTELGAVARLAPGTRVLDLACGKAEMPCRRATEHGISGVGVDISEVFVHAARLRATGLAVADRVPIELGDASTFACAPDAFDVACCIGASWIGGGVAGTVDLLRRAAAPVASA